MAKITYPLEQVLAVKKDRVEKAEKIFEERKRAVEIEQNKLKKLEDERDRVADHHNAKLTQLRKALDEGTTSDEVLQMKAYLKVVKEQLIKEEKKVADQKEVVRDAEKKREEAHLDLKRKRVEEEKLKLHREEWMKEAKAEIEKKEAIEHDEIGQVLYETRRKKKME